jgi:DnaJ-class molecular chaperone
MRAAEHRHGWPVELFSICKGASMHTQSATNSATDGAIQAPSSQRNPGDESAPGTPQTAEDICPQCQGSGEQGNSACANCGGTGRIVKIIGDA